jgi:hypothetical protein
VILIKYELYNFDAKIRKKRASTNAEALQKNIREIKRLLLSLLLALQLQAHP